MININKCSIRNKTDSLDIALFKHDPHITVITETWLCDEIDEVIFLAEYKVYRRDRASRGGSVALLVKNNVKSTLFGHITDIEGLRIKLSCWGHQLYCTRYIDPPM